MIIAVINNPTAKGDHIVEIRIRGIFLVDSNLRIFIYFIEMWTTEHLSTFHFPPQIRKAAAFLGVPDV